RNPGFNENYYGFRTFGNLLEEAQQRGLLDFGRDEKSGAYVSRGSGQAAQRVEPVAAPVVEEVVVAEVIVEDTGAPVHHVAPTGEVEDAIEVQHPAPDESGRGRQRSDRKPATKRSGQRGRGGKPRGEATAPEQTDAESASTGEATPAASTGATRSPRTPRGQREPAARAEAPAAAPAPAPVEEAAPLDMPAAKKAASRSRRPRKPAAKKAASTNNEG
ncbi:MAG: hypothetical protein HYX44_15660, partial [Aquabacterium sp.]|nr:hypothetical protein [Aquabacterium sp.]